MSGLWVRGYDCMCSTPFESMRLGSITHGTIPGMHMLRPVRPERVLPATLRLRCAPSYPNAVGDRDASQGVRGCAQVSEASMFLAGVFIFGNGGDPGMNARRSWPYYLWDPLIAAGLRWCYASFPVAGVSQEARWPWGEW